MTYPRLTASLLAALSSLLLMLSCSSNSDDNGHKLAEKRIPISIESAATLKGVNNDTIPFAGPPSNFSQVKADLPLLIKGLKAYESNDLAGCSNALGQYYGIAGFANLDEMLGYVVAAYGSLELHEKAAREVLKRDQRRQPWNYAMKLDLAICLRNYALQNGLEKGVALVDQLKAEFGGKLASPLLMVLPRGKMTYLHQGILAGGNIWWDKNKFEENIPSFIERFPNDTFIDHAYFMVGQPEKALAANPDGLLKDVLLYNIGYQCIKEISKEENRLRLLDKGITRDYVSDRPRYTEILQFVDFQGSQKTLAEKAYKYFQQYVEEFPQRPHADDAAYWLAWIDAQYQRYDKAIEWTRKVRSLGNKDYHEKYNFPVKLELELTPFLNTQQLETIAKASDEYDYRTEAILINLLDRLPYAEALRELEDAKYKPYEVKALYHLTKREYSELALENALEAAKLTESKGGKQIANISFIIQNIEDLISLGDIPRAEMYGKIGAGLKNYFLEKEAALAFIDQAMKKWGDQEDLSTLLYLKAVMLKNSNPSRVEGVVEEMLNRYTGSKLADDALAELIYVQTMVLPNIDKAEANLNRLFSLYPNGNARDNALNWVAKAYLNGKGTGNNKVDREKARYYYQRIRQEFPLTRFAGYAMQNLQRL